MLYYIRGQQTIGVPSSSVERRALVVKRNDVAAAIHDILHKEKMKLPDLISDKMSCNYCNHQLSCSLAFKSFEGKDPAAHPNPDILQKNTDQLKQGHLDYFQKFSKLCVQEAQVSTTSAKMPWDDSCKKHGNLTLESVSEKHGFYHKFTTAAPFNTRTSFVSRGDYIIISKDDGTAYNICAGFVTELNADHFEVYVSDVDLSASPHHRSGPCYNIVKHSSLSSLHTRSVKISI